MYTFLFYSLNIFYKAADTLFQLLPYLIAGTFAGEALKFVRLHNFVEKLNKKGRFLSTVTATFLGILSPLCTYGTVPVVLQLNNSGVAASTLIVFLISSSMMNPQLFFMTWGGISLKIALARVLTIIIFSFLMGLILNALPERWILNKKIIEEKNSNTSGCTPSKKVFTLKVYFLNIVKSLEYTGFYITIGVILAAMIEVLVPSSFSNMLFDQNKLLQLLIAAALSVPFYTCGGGAIPVIKSFISGGMSSGTALAFLNVGSATRITTLMALAAIVRPLFIIFYVIILIAFSIVTGYFFI